MGGGEATKMHSSRFWKPEVLHQGASKAGGGGEGPLPVSQIITFSLCPHVVGREREIASFVLSLLPRTLIPS